MQGEGSKPAQTTNLFLLEDLEDSSRTAKLADGDLNALHAVADWIKTFVAMPNKDLGRTGPVCPFVPGACERKTLWLAPEQIANRSLPDVVELINGYKKLLLRAQPIGCFDRFVCGSCKRLRGRPLFERRVRIMEHWDVVRSLNWPCVAVGLALKGCQWF